MLKNTLTIRIEWSDCDPAGITFYPNYFRWFDQGAWRLFEAAGFYPGDLARERGVYIPLVDASAQFSRPGHLGDDLRQESWVAEWREKMFVVKHAVYRGDEKLLEGSELRAWVVKDAADPRRFRSLPIPPEVRAALEK
ncbi:MAG: acyl-CoA thioesterase [Zoogloeaceae bacterium]|jgi:4-hydroxybenzoyl-CoA thioesterase|nr:acyl-CoA thioesterase [Zoogloeaceae bacterium]